MGRVDVLLLLLPCVCIAMQSSAYAYGRTVGVVMQDTTA